MRSVPSASSLFCNFLPNNPIALNLLFLIKNCPLSHSKERSEKICLNCNAPLYGRYCHICGQQNIEPKQSVWHLVTHFFYDITHFDGKFFVTLKDLLIKPGFLSREYMIGRRMSYLDPVRMYIFTSAFFFIIFFSVYNVKQLGISNKIKFNTESAEQGLQKAMADAKTKTDSNAIQSALANVRNLHLNEDKESVKKEHNKEKKAAGGSAENEEKDSANNNDLNINLLPGEHHYNSVAEYDSIQKNLPENVRDGFFRKLMQHKAIGLSEKYRGNKSGFIKEWLTIFMHSFPKLLFISLPIFALLLKLLYVRRKQFYYVDHGIFAIHLYIYSFIALLVIFGVNYISKLTGWNGLGWINAAITLFSLFYFYKAMRNFYQQRRFKTFLKYTILCILSFTVILTLFVIFFVFSILEV
ncbi:MAG: hypothetical protein C5B59_11025 [Bacteroidetes bacterium]|nr:MAG: hypothetical protein C5B59_11025 [Bacteroidota bacterium]